MNKLMNNTKTEITNDMSVQSRAFIEDQKQMLTHRINNSSNTDISSTTYIDYNATTPVDPRVIKYMLPLFDKCFGNPSSEHHGYGKDANARINHARLQVTELVGMQPSDAIFTSGATEANNIALRGIAEGMDKKPIVLVGSTEHKSVLDTAKNLERLDLIILHEISVSSDGVINPETLESAISEHGADIVSIMAANSETGVINPIRELVKVSHEVNAIFHCDATQAIGRIDFDAADAGVDMVSLSGHKMYGPKGTGALVANREARKKLCPVTFGGGQEGGLRSGTLNVPGIVGLGKACEIAASEGIADGARQAILRDRLERQLAERLDGVTVNGAGAPRLPNTSSMRFEGALAYAIIANAPNLAISSGSACSASTIEPSHVLVAMSLSDQAADESIRFSLGRQTTEDDIDRAIEQVVRAVNRVRGLDSQAPETVTPKEVKVHAS